MRQRIVGVMLVLGLAWATAAAGGQNGAATRTNDLAAILEQQQQIRAEATGRKGRYGSLDEKKRQALFDHQDKVTRLLEGKRSVDDLSQTDRIAVFNSLEAIESIVNDAEDDRMVCERVKPVGSNRPKTVCMTVAERRAAREAANHMHRRDQACVKDPTSGFCL
ncbi:MAG TPA: hypothetical protein VEY50_03835 [Lysobacter sp.]|nr:hypothetical protein [Lysobacter sp.]